MDILTAAEQREADALRNQLAERVYDSTYRYPFSRYLVRIRREDNLDLLRCLGQFFTSDDKNLFMGIEWAQDVIRKELKREAFGYLTLEMVAMENLISDCYGVDSMQESYRASAYVFENMDRTEDILYLIKHRGLRNITDIDAMVKDMDISSHPNSLRSGLI